MGVKYTWEHKMRAGCGSQCTLSAVPQKDMASEPKTISPMGVMSAPEGRLC